MLNRENLLMAFADPYYMNEVLLEWRLFIGGENEKGVREMYAILATSLGSARSPTAEGYLLMV